MEKNKTNKKERGITLIALVITVIIMLILAGVAISVLTSDGGLFEKTQSAADKYQQAAQNEADQITSLMNDIDKYLNGLPTGEADKKVATIEVSNITETTFTLTARGKHETGISKYEFYINGELENTVTTTEETVTYNVIGKTAGTTYTCKVRVYDIVGNYKDSSEINVTTKIPSAPVATTVSLGDYVNYDAGIWTVEDFNKITNSDGGPTLHSTVYDETSNNQTLPDAQGEFGGFELGQSRNTNSTEYDSNYMPRTEGWRVWSIDNTTGVVTIISAGHPETYFLTDKLSLLSLKNRDYSMYENSYAQTGSAHILTGEEAVRWYNMQFKTNYILSNSDITGNINFLGKSFTTDSPIDVLENGSYYWLASPLGSGSSLYYVNPSYRSALSSYYVGYRCPYPSFSKI